MAEIGVIVVTVVVVEVIPLKLNYNHFYTLQSIIFKTLK